MTSPLRNGVVPALQAELDEAKRIAVRFAHTVLEMSENPNVSIGDEPCESGTECPCVCCAALTILGKWG